jgi:hypothetical protein
LSRPRQQPRPQSIGQAGDEFGRDLQCWLAWHDQRSRRVIKRRNSVPQRALFRRNGLATGARSGAAAVAFAGSTDFRQLFLHVPAQSTKSAVFD